MAVRLRVHYVWKLGKFNQFTYEIEYPDLATFEKAQNTFESDAELMALFRNAPQLGEGFWPWDELEIEAPHLA